MSDVHENTLAADWDSLARAASRNEAPTSVDVLQEFLTLAVGETLYAIPIERVREILRMRALTPVPRVPPVVRGVITLRGDVVEVLDLRQRLGPPATDVPRRARIILLRTGDGPVSGMLVDKVHEVVRIEASEVRPAASGDSENVAGLFARNDQFVSILDLDRVLSLDATD